MFHGDFVAGYLKDFSVIVVADFKHIVQVYDSVEFAAVILVDGGAQNIAIIRDGNNGQINLFIIQFQPSYFKTVKITVYFG